MRVALYLRVSLDEQTIENQRLVLTEVAASRGWQITHTFTDEGISGSKGREERPGFDALQRAVAAGEVDLVAAWALDRLGRSVLDLQLFRRELKNARVELYLHQQQLDTSTPAGSFLFTTLGAAAELERDMIVARTKAGLARARACGKRLGRPSSIPDDVRARVAALRGQLSTRRCAAVTGVSQTHVRSIWSAA